MFLDLFGDTALAWPAVIALAWVLGEICHRYAGIPRISIYSLCGFVLSYAQTAGTSQAVEQPVILLTNIALGLVLFEFSYRVNIRWLKINRWIALTGLLEAVVTFATVYWIARQFSMETTASLLLAALTMATSPVELLRVINERRCSGQVTERTIHIAALNVVLAVFAFNIIVGLWTFQTSGSLLGAATKSGMVVMGSCALGAAFGMLIPVVLRRLAGRDQNVTIALAVAVILLMAVAQALKVSPLIAALAFGMIARHRRITLSPAQRNFGVLGDLMGVVLFVFVGASLTWQSVLAGLPVALVLLGGRLLVKTACAVLFARMAGTSLRKGALTGVALAPMSVLAISLLIQSRHIGIDVVDQVAPLAAATLLSVFLGPIMTQWALKRANETFEETETHHADRAIQTFASLDPRR